MYSVVPSYVRYTNHVDEMTRAVGAKFIAIESSGHDHTAV